MKVFKKVKAAGAAGLAALMLTIGAAGITADAAVLPDPSTCPHSWTAEQERDSGKEVAGYTEVHKTNNGKDCTITYYGIYYDIICRTCGTKVGERFENTRTTHSIVHQY